MNEDILDARKTEPLTDPLHFAGPEEVNIKDIATSLSRLCYFLGFGDLFYSAAQHAVVTSTAVQYSILISEKFQQIEENGTELERAKATYKLWQWAMKALCLGIGDPYLGMLGSLNAGVITRFREQSIPRTQIFYDKYGLGKAEDSYVVRIDNRTFATELTWVTDLSDVWKDVLVARGGADIQPFPVEVIEEELRVCWDMETARTKFLDRFKDVWMLVQKWRKTYNELKDAKEEVEVAAKEREAIQNENKGGMDF